MNHMLKYVLQVIILTLGHTVQTRGIQPNLYYLKKNYGKLVK